MMLPVRWTGRARGASLSNDRCVLMSGDLTVFFSCLSNISTKGFGPSLGLRTGHSLRPFRASGPLSALNDGPVGGVAGIRRKFPAGRLMCDAVAAPDGIPAQGCGGLVRLGPALELARE